MNLYHLRYFVTLAHLEHYTKAAETLAITQPSLSHAIATLEKELGVKLFEKEGRNIVLTKCGRIFCEDVEHSLSILDSSIDSLMMTKSGGGTIDIGLLRTLSTDLVPRFVRGFLEKNPDKNIDFKFHNDTGMTHDILKGLKEKKYDIAFCSMDENEPDIEFVPFSKQELVVIVPDGHPLSHQYSVTLAETLPYPQVRFTKRSGLRNVIDTIFKNYGQFPEYIYEVDEDQAVAGLVSNKFGIAIVPYMKILRFMKLKILPITDLSWERYFYIATLKNTYHTPALESFKNYIIENSQI